MGFRLLAVFCGALLSASTIWASTNVLEVASIVGAFVVGEILTGSSSGATRKLRTVDKDPLDDGFADNTNIETQADLILDFSEANPFGTP